MEKIKHNTVIFGATGLVGGHVTEMLLDNQEVNQVLSIGRRELDNQHPKLVQSVADFASIQNFVPPIEVDSAVIALGTTLKQAGSAAAFRKVDFDYIINAAQWAYDQGCQTAAIVSAVNANANSAVLYSQVKGQMEDALRQIGFVSLTLVKPSLLLGDRAEFRLGEALSAPLMRIVAPLMQGPLTKYQPVHARQVAACLVTAIVTPQAGCNEVFPTQKA